MKEHPRYSEILPFSCVRAYTRRRNSKRQWQPQNACILERLTEPTGEKQPLSTQTLAQSLVCYTLSEVYRLPVRTYAAIAPSEPYRWRPSSHKANLVPQNKRQDTIATMIPCLCLFTVPSSPSAEPPVNKKRTRTLSHREGFGYVLYGGELGTRTPDPLRVMQVL